MSANSEVEHSALPWIEAVLRALTQDHLLDPVEGSSREALTLATLHSGKSSDEQLKQATMPSVHL